MARTRKNFYRRSGRRKAPAKSYKATCARCGKELMVQVSPPEGKALLCLDCFHK